MKQHDFEAGHICNPKHNEQHKSRGDSLRSISSAGKLQAQLVGGGSDLAHEQCIWGFLAGPALETRLQNNIVSFIIDTMLEISVPNGRPKATPRLKPTKSERTRAAILNAALEFLWSKPFRDLTVGNLMSPLDIGRSAFYQYFRDLHELMETLLHELEGEILSVANPWLGGEMDSVATLKGSLAELVRVCHDRGPLLRAITDAAVTDHRLERVWNDFLGRFDEAIVARIEAEQETGRIPRFDARAVAMALNRMDAYAFIQAFGRHPRDPQGPVLEGITHIWMSALYPWSRPDSEA